MRDWQATANRTAEQILDRIFQAEMPDLFLAVRTEAQYVLDRITETLNGLPEAAEIHEVEAYVELEAAAARTHRESLAMSPEPFFEGGPIAQALQDIRAQVSGELFAIVATVLLHRLGLQNTANLRERVESLPRETRVRCSPGMMESRDLDELVDPCEAGTRRVTEALALAIHRRVSMLSLG